MPVVAETGTRLRRKQPWRLYALAPALLLPLLFAILTVIRPVHLSIGGHGVHVGQDMGLEDRALASRRFSASQHGLRVKLGEGVGTHRDVVVVSYRVSWW